MYDTDIAVFVFLRTLFSHKKGFLSGWVVLISRGRRKLKRGNIGLPMIRRRFSSTASCAAAVDYASYIWYVV